MSDRKLVQRSEKVAYMQVLSALERMRGFTSLNQSKNPIEYSRQYVDELFETTDTVGMSPSIDFEMDYYLNDVVSEKIATIFDDELVGDAANVDIVVVDFTKEDGVTPGTFAATKRTWAVIPDSEGDGTDAYKYSGSFRVKSNIAKGTVTTADDWATCTFTEEA